MLVRFLEDLGEALFKPRELALVLKAEGRGLGTALATVVIVGAMAGLGVSALSTTILSNIASPAWLGIGSMIAGTSILIVTFSYVVSWLLYGLLLHLALSLLGGRAGVETGLAITGVSFIGLWPKIALPLVGVAVFKTLGAALSGYMLGLPLGLLWMHYSLVLGLSEAYGVSPGRVIASILLVVAIIIVALALLLLPIIVL